MGAHLGQRSKTKPKKLVSTASHIRVYRAAVKGNRSEVFAGLLGVPANSLRRTPVLGPNRAKSVERCISGPDLKRTCPGWTLRSALDPKRTSRVRCNAAAC